MTSDWKTCIDIHCMDVQLGLGSFPANYLLRWRALTTVKTFQEAARVQPAGSGELIDWVWGIILHGSRVLFNAAYLLQLVDLELDLGWRNKALIGLRLIALLWRVVVAVATHVWCFCCAVSQSVVTGTHTLTHTPHSRRHHIRPRTKGARDSIACPQYALTLGEP